MTYVNTLKKREPEFVWELQQSALRCRLMEEQRMKEGLPPLTKIGEEMRDDAEMSNKTSKYADTSGNVIYLIQTISLKAYLHSN
jgi:hypothetical protein